MKSTFTSEPSQLCHVREFIRTALAPHGLSTSATDLLVLAVDEACTNILRHAYKECAGNPIVIRVDCPKGMLRVRIRDHGAALDPACIAPRNLETIRPGGLGVHIIRRAFDSVRYLPRKCGTELVLLKKLPSSE